MSIAETFWNQRFDMAADQVQAAAKERQHYAVITEEDLAEVFGNGTYKLPRVEAAELLEARTNAHRTSCYRALRLDGRFARILCADSTTLSWRQV